MRLTPEYKKYIASPKWKAKCEQYFAVYGYWCKACGKKRDLHIHHLSYDRFGRELLSDLISLCQEHHRGAHAYHRKLGARAVTIRVATLAYIKTIQKQLGRRAQNRRS